MAEIDRLPCGLLDEILQSRSYARAREANAIDPQGWQSSELRSLAMEIGVELVAEEIASRGHGE